MKKKKYVFVLLIIVLGLIIGMVSCSVARNAGAEEKEVAATSEKEEVKAEVKAEVKKEEAKEEVKESKKEETVKTEKVDKQEKKEEKKDAGTVVTESKKKTETASTTTKEETQTTPKKETVTETKKEETKKEEPKKEQHTHTWEEVYKEVDNGHYEQQLVKDAWVEEKTITKKAYRIICKTCEYIFPHPTASEHIIAHYTGLSTCNSYKTVLIDVDETIQVPHEAEYADVWIPKIEKVLDYYKCDCGATK